MHNTIAISKKCCYPCFLLGEILKEKKKKQFKLYGTHGRIDPWMPPAGLDVDVLMALRIHFIEKLKQIIETRQKASQKKQYAYHSSPASSVEDNTQDSPSPPWFQKPLFED